MSSNIRFLNSRSAILHECYMNKFSLADSSLRSESAHYYPVLCYVQNALSGQRVRLLQLILLIVRLGVRQRLGGALGRQAEPIAHLLAHVRVASALVVGDSLDSGGSRGDLVSRRQLAVLDLEDVSGVLFGFLRPDVSVLVLS